MNVLWNSLNNRKFLCYYFFESYRMCSQNYLGLLIFWEVDLWSYLSSVVMDLFGFLLLFVKLRSYIFLVNHAFNLDCQFIDKKLQKIFSHNYFSFFHDHGSMTFLIATIKYLSKILNQHFFLLLTWLSQILEIYFYFL